MSGLQVGCGGMESVEGACEREPCMRAPEEARSGGTLPYAMVLVCEKQCSAPSFLLVLILSQPSSFELLPQQFALLGGSAKQVRVLLGATNQIRQHVVNGTVRNVFVHGVTGERTHRGKSEG